jgi:dipeptidase E
MILTKKLFLASWFAGSAGLLPDFVGEDLTGKRVVFIPTAGVCYGTSGEMREATDFINNLDKEALQNLGLIVEELEVSGQTAEAVEKSISNADCIFVCGGSTFFLLQELKRKGGDKLISRHIEKGKLYMGTSAGSLIVQKDIVAEENDDPKLAPDLNGDFSGLGFIDFYLYVHYGRHYFGNDDEAFNKYYAHLDCIKIDDNQAVTVDGEKVEIVTAPESCIPAITLS